jgi:hypothetical protein
MEGRRRELNAKRQLNRGATTTRRTPVEVDRAFRLVRRVKAYARRGWVADEAHVEPVAIA